METALSKLQALVAPHKQPQYTSPSGKTTLLGEGGFMAKDIDESGVFIGNESVFPITFSNK